ncbi:MAG: PepSY domain-containing protein [Candidatus Rokubacteria bacterium]|nr:PepSY domain-containing protein [Candidatus Rokubacteria bacterium]
MGRVASRGFTLIEIAVVLLLLAVATAVVVPGVGRGADALRARAEVAGFSAFLRHAREQAITRREPHEVRVDPARGQMVLVLLAPDGPAVRGSKQFAVPLRIEADPPQAMTIRFSPQGVSTGGLYRIEGPGRRVWEVAVDPVTGRVINRRIES